MFGIIALASLGLASICLGIHLAPLEEDIWGERRKTRNRAAQVSDWLFIGGTIMVWVAATLVFIWLWEHAP